MASYYDKSQVSVQASPRHQFPMHGMHLTTGSFMQFDCAFAKEFPANHDIKFNHQTFIRTMPLKKPIMGSVQFHKSAYFVPFRTIWEPFTDFLTDTPHVQQEGASILSNTPLVNNHVLIEFILKYCSTSSGASSTLFDFVTVNSDNTYNYYLYNAFGQHVIKLLNQLGYQPDYLAYDQNASNADYATTDSALPLLCLSKVYIDYFYPVQYAMTGYYINLEGMFRRNYIYTLSENDLLSIFRVCYFVSYASDYFVSAFDNPLGPSANTFSSDFQIKDLSTFTPGVSEPNVATLKVSQNNSNNMPVVEQRQASYTVVMSQYMVDSLKALTNYIRRHGLSGSRALERYLADWGVALSVEKLRRCYKLSEKHYPLQVADIVSSADTIQEVAGEIIGSQLGDMAGKGVAFNGDFNIETKSDEFGYLIIINTIMPDIGYMQGVSRDVMHKTKLDFLNGDFDGLACRPIINRELFVGNARPSTGDSIFGFTPMYSEYKTLRDIVSGAFRLKSQSTGLMGWSTVREFSDELGDDQFEMVHNLNFILGNDSEQYNRIFLNDDEDNDKFVIVHRANIDCSMPAVPLYDFYDFEDNKKKILMEVNGTKSN